jgi:hypothetical protein
VSMLGRGVPNRPIIIRNDLADPPVLTTAAPVVVAAPPASTWFNTHPVLQARGAFEDSSDFSSRSQTTVVTRQPDTRYRGGFSYGTRNTLQDPLVLTTPAPIVISGSSGLYFNKSFNQISTAPFIAPPTTGPTVVPQVLATPPTPSWFDVGAPTVLRNTLQDPPVLTTPGPIVVTRQPASPWLTVKPSQVLDNIQLGVPAQGSPTPVIVPGPRSLLYQPTKTIVIDNIQLGTTSNVVRPICYSGTVVDENKFAGTVIDDLVLNGTVVSSFAFAGSLAHGNIFAGTMLGWCMQEVDISAGEFNDESWDFTITSASNPFNITGLTIEAYFKTAAGVSDTDPSTVKLSTATGDITITDGPNGKGTVSLPSTDLQPGDNLTFYRLDIIQSGKRHTALYGKVGITPL